MNSKPVDLTETQMNDIALMCIKMGLNPADKGLIKHIHGCDCISCKGAVAMLVLVGDRITAIIETEGACLGPRN